MELMKIKDWNIQELTGYEPKTTFYTDFSIAEAYGYPAVVDTYNRVMEAWSDDYVFLTELVMVLNWKIWEHYDNGDAPLAKLYDSLWEEADSFAQTHLEEDELDYFYTTTG